jgi:hypothetical protein
VNAEQAPKDLDVGADPPSFRGRPPPLENWGSHPAKRLEPVVPPGYWRWHVCRGDPTQHGKPRSVEARDLQPDSREGKAGPGGVTDRPAVLRTPGNAGRGKGPEFKTSVIKSARAGRLAMSLVPPLKVQKLQTALHAKAKESPSYRFYRLYDKLYRRDILEFAYLRCRSNDGAPGVDGQTFADIEAYGRDRWLDEPGL